MRRHASSATWHGAPWWCCAASPGRRPAEARAGWSGRQVHSRALRPRPACTARRTRHTRPAAHSPHARGSAGRAARRYACTALRPRRGTPGGWQSHTSLPRAGLSSSCPRRRCTRPRCRRRPRRRPCRRRRRRRRPCCRQSWGRTEGTANSSRAARPGVRGTPTGSAAQSPQVPAGNAHAARRRPQRPLCNAAPSEAARLEGSAQSGNPRRG
mmetsp:Transcript_38791/g.115332  ORF Transcript_38791/g.115332 Transcript_38791/m.115332 type:complete len:212 (+) Transcript_38791:3382-4017(+)